MPDIVCNGFKGIMRFSETLEAEKTVHNYLAHGVNIILDLQGNAHVMTGADQVVDTGSTTLIYSLYYSTTLKLLIGVSGSNIFWFNPVTKTGGTNAVALGSNQLAYAEWPATKKCYMSDGTTYWKMAISGTVTAVTTSPLANVAGTCIFAHRDTMFIGGVPGQPSTYLFPSTQGNPEMFTLSDAISLSEGGNTLNAMTTLKGILRVHKNTTIYAIVGTSFSGTAQTKDLEVVNMTTGRGGLFTRAVNVQDGIEYFIGYDGMYRDNGDHPERISRSIDGLISKLWPAPPSLGHVTPVISTWGPDIGSRYMLFQFVDNQGVGNFIFRFNTDTGDWLQIDIPTPPNEFAFNPDNMRTYFNYTFATNGHVDICKFENVSFFDGQFVTGYLVTNPIDGGSRTRDHQWGELYAFPGDHNLLGLQAGTDGLFPSIPLLFPQRLTSMAPVEIDQTSHLLQIKATKTGGGSFLLGGFSLAIQGDDESRPSRDYAESRQNSVATMMRQGPLIVPTSVVLTTGQHTVTHTFNTQGAPISSVICGFQGWSMNGFLFGLTNNNGTVTITIPGAVTIAGGEIVYLTAVAQVDRLFDSYLTGGTVFIKDNTTTLLTVNHNLNVVPDAFFIVPSTQQSMQVLNLDGRNFEVALGAPPSQGGYFNWIAAVNGVTDKYFKCGFTSTSPIPHGLGVKPRAVAIFPNATPTPAYQITSIDATNINWVSGSPVYWIAVA